MYLVGGGDERSGWIKKSKHAKVARLMPHQRMAQGTRRGGGKRPGTEFQPQKKATLGRGWTEETCCHRKRSRNRQNGQTTGGGGGKKDGFEKQRGGRNFVDVKKIKGGGGLTKRTTPRQAKREKKKRGHTNRSCVSGRKRWVEGDS